MYIRSIFITFISFTLLIASVSAIETQGYKSKLAKPIIDISLSAFSLNEEALLSRGSSAFIEGYFSYDIQDDLKLRFWPVANFISGQLTSRDPQSPLSNSIYLKEASIEKKINAFFQFKAGALYQKEFLPGMAGQAKSFPAIGLFIPLIIQNHLLELHAQAAVPTSSGLATSTTEFESSSSLLSGAIFLKSNWTNNLSTQFSYAHFKFNHLSSAAAYDSLQRGNTVIKFNSSAGSYVYKYAGDEFQLNSNYNFSDSFEMKLKASFIKNNLAPTDLNQGYYISISPIFKISPTYSMGPIVEHYHVQSDGMVAVFSDTTFGRTNRDGYRYGINLENSTYNLQFIYANSKLIQTNPFQSADKSLFVNFDLKNITL